MEQPPVPNRCDSLQCKIFLDMIFRERTGPPDMHCKSTLLTSLRSAELLVGSWLSRTFSPPRLIYDPRQEGTDDNSGRKRPSCIALDLERPRARKGHYLIAKRDFSVMSAPRVEAPLCLTGSLLDAAAASPAAQLDHK